MRGGWNGAAPPALAKPRGAGLARLVLRGVAALGLTLVVVAAVLAARGLDRLRRAIAGRQLPALAPWLVHGWGRLALPLTGLRAEVVGRPMAHPGVLVANHAGWLDVVVLARAAPVFFVSKAEVARWPGIGAVARAVGTIFVDRRPGEAQRGGEILRRRLLRGDRMALFPEGTSTDGRRVLPFKSSLFAAFVGPDLRERLWVQPVSVVYRAPPGLPEAFYGWWGDMAFAPHAATVLAWSRGGAVEVVFHPPLRAADFPDRKALAAAAEVAVAGGVMRRLDVRAPAAE